MGAHIDWSAARRGSLRYGRAFHSYGDDYDGCGVIEDHGHYCTIGPIAGPFDSKLRDDILDACSKEGFLEARVMRNGKWWSYDLTSKPYKRSLAPRH